MGGMATLSYAPSLVPSPLPNGPCPLPNGPRPLPNGGRQHAGDETIMYQLPSPPLHISLLQYSVHEFCLLLFCTGDSSELEKSMPCIHRCCTWSLLIGIQITVQIERAENWQC